MITIGISTNKNDDIERIKNIIFNILVFNKYKIFVFSANEILYDDMPKSISRKLINLYNMSKKERNAIEYAINEDKIRNGKKYTQYARLKIALAEKLGFDFCILTDIKDNGRISSNEFDLTDFTIVYRPYNKKRDMTFFDRKMMKPYGETQIIKINFIEELPEVVNDIIKIEKELR